MVVGLRVFGLHFRGFAKKLRVIDVIPKGSVTSMSQGLRSRGISSHAVPNKEGSLTRGSRDLFATGNKFRR